MFFIAVLVYVFEDIREGLLFEILYANNLVLMVDSMEEMQMKYDRWKSSIEQKE